VIAFGNTLPNVFTREKLVPTEDFVFFTQRFKSEGRANFFQFQ